MADRSFSDLSLAALYDALNPWGRSDDFYLDLVLSARSVLDVGCGTGRLLGRALEAGHEGRLCGLDPAAAMLVQARRRAHAGDGSPGRDRRAAVEWVLGDLAAKHWEREFDLVVMTGHAFQVLLGDEELRVALAAIRQALSDDGRFVFETRNPAARAWEGWTPEHVHEVTDAHGEVVRVRHEVETPEAGDRVTFTETFEHPGWEQPQVSSSTLRFLGPDALDGFLTEAGFAVAERFGDWGRGPLTPTAPEIITVARPTGRGLLSPSRSRPPAPPAPDPG
ncbi:MULTISPECIES: class I SAM-dependent methyltransferase [unclassified Streptomyces]|uniref:class I SAM-dependent methyltransferase n=1 Tax=unclassified Streptomyces TaxID=2593676 RepID=UPI002DD984A3|nr:class I SAM-dependent methyltransferase [Streptomyces sp. NBC_00243]WRZ19994.1 class I SAM-dependent methyltransferase [Streptomyces sp. NBC_00243]